MSASAGGIRAGKAYVELGTRNKALLDGLNAAQAKLSSFASGVKKLGIGIAAAFSFKKAFEGLKRFSEMDRELLNPEQTKAADTIRQQFRNVEDSLLTLTASIVNKFGPAFGNIADIARIGMEGLADAINEAQPGILEDFATFTDAIANALGAGKWDLAAKIAIEAIALELTKLEASLNDFLKEMEVYLNKAQAAVVTFVKDLATGNNAIGDFAENLGKEIAIGVQLAFSKDMESFGMKPRGSTKALKDELYTPMLPAGGALFAAANPAHETKKNEQEFLDQFGKDAKHLEGQKAVNNRREAFRKAQEEANATRRQMLDAKLKDSSGANGTKFTVAGTFSGAAASMLGASAHPFKQIEVNTNKAAEESKKQTALLRDIRDNGGLRYA